MNSMTVFKLVIDYQSSQNLEIGGLSTNLDENVTRD